MLRRHIKNISNYAPAVDGDSLARYIQRLLPKVRPLIRNFPYDDDDRLHTHLGPADVTVDFSADRIGLKVRKNGVQHSYCYPLDKVPIDIFGDWRPE
jgi:hypothetical protein